MRRAPRRVAFAAVLACAAGLVNGGTAYAADYPYVPEDPKTTPGGTCATSGPLPWIGITDVTLTVRVGGESVTEPSPQAHFVVLKEGSDESVMDVATAVTPGTVATLRVPRDLLTDGEGYRWRARLESAGGSSEWTGSCGFRMDLTRPAAPEIAFTDADTYPQGAPPGTVRHLRFTLPEGTEASRICFAPLGQPLVCGADDGVPVGEDGTASTTFITPEATGPGRLSARAVDRAGNVSDIADAEYWVTYPVAEQFGDYNGDGHPDLLGVATDGTLTLRPGLPGGGYGGGQVADRRDWSKATVARAGWMVNRYGPEQSNDVRNDIVALREGKLFAYPGDGEGGFGAAMEIRGYDWSGVTEIAVNDAQTTLPMLLAKEGDRLLLFEVNNAGELRVGSPSVLAVSGWSTKSARFAAPESWGLPSVWARDVKKGTLELIPIEYGSSQLWDLGTPVPVATTGWNDRQRPYAEIVGDVDGDGRSDIVSSDRRGALWMHPMAQDGTLGDPVMLQARGWRGVAFF